MSQVAEQLDQAASKGCGVGPWLGAGTGLKVQIRGASIHTYRTLEAAGYPCISYPSTIQLSRPPNSGEGKAGLENAVKGPSFGEVTSSSPTRHPGFVKIFPFSFEPVCFFLNSLMLNLRWDQKPVMAYVLDQSSEGFGVVALKRPIHMETL